jgi:hypothetical protein
VPFLQWGVGMNNRRILPQLVAEVVHHRRAGEIAPEPVVQALLGHRSASFWVIGVRLGRLKEARPLRETLHQGIRPASPERHVG